MYKCRRDNNEKQTTYRAGRASLVPLSRFCGVGSARGGMAYVQGHAQRMSKLFILLELETQLSLLDVPPSGLCVVLFLFHAFRVLVLLFSLV